MKVVVEHSAAVSEGFRVAQLRGMFDLKAEKTSAVRIEAELPGKEEQWQIGLIVGPSGSGKSSVARQVYGDAVCQGFEWETGKSVIEQMPGESLKVITGMLSAVGFASPPAWLRPFQVLSGGEQFRATLARLLLSPGELAVMDEFTSVVDRTVAKVGSAAVGKAVRRGKTKRFVAVSCHYDIAQWLEPDWVLDMNTGRLTRGRLCRPGIKVTVHTCGREMWGIFARHHYLSGNLPIGGACYVARVDLGDGPTLAGFIGSASIYGWPGRKRIARVVVLPDFQGVGVAGAFLDAVAEIEAAGCKALSLATSHPAMMGALARSGKWRCVDFARHGNRAGRKGAAIVISSQGRPLASFRWVGGPRGRI